MNNQKLDAFFTKLLPHRNIGWGLTKEGKIRTEQPTGTFSPLTWVSGNNDLHDAGVLQGFSLDETIDIVGAEDNDIKDSPTRERIRRRLLIALGLTERKIDPPESKEAL